MIENIRNNFKDYIIKNNLKSAIIGISGGLDSAVNAALLYPMCKELGIPFIGRYIHIESNKEIEWETARWIGTHFCTDFKSIDLTDYFKSFPFEDTETNYRIRQGNVKARLRMIYLRDLAKQYNGLMIDNSNYTEWNLGFFTIADGGDYSPLKYCWKTEVYNIAKELLKECNRSQANALQKAIDMIPTDGLDISNSDLGQIGAESYEQVDAILKDILEWNHININSSNLTDYMHDYITSEVPFDIPLQVVKNVAERYFNSKFKRK